MWPAPWLVTPGLSTATLEEEAERRGNVALEQGPSVGPARGQGCSARWPRALCQEFTYGMNERRGTQQHPCLGVAPRGYGHLEGGILGLSGCASRGLGSVEGKSWAWATVVPGDQDTVGCARAGPPGQE